MEVILLLSLSALAMLGTFLIVILQGFHIINLSDTIIITVIVDMGIINFICLYGTSRLFDVIAGLLKEK